MDNRNGCGIITITINRSGDGLKVDRETRIMGLTLVEIMGAMKCVTEELYQEYSGKTKTNFKWSKDISDEQ